MTDATATPTPVRRPSRGVTSTATAGRWRSTAIQDGRWRGAVMLLGVIAALAGGVGAARMLSGLVAAVPADRITAVVNTGDDTVVHGLHVSPDLDTVTYTLAGMINPQTGWGLRGETWAAMQ